MKAKGKILITILVVVSFLGMHCSVYDRGQGLKLRSGQKPGAQILVQKKDGLYMAGELIAVKPSSLLLLSFKGTDVSIDTEDIRVIKILKKPTVLKRAGLGLLIGGGGGALLGLVAGDDKSGSLRMTAGEKAVFLGIIIGLAGLVYGGIMGALAGKDKTIQVEGQTEVEIVKI